MARLPVRGPEPRDPGDRRRRLPGRARARNGYARPDVDVEVVALRARASLAAPLTVTDLPAPAARPAQGPAVVAEPDCTLWVPEGWAATPGPAGALDRGAHVNAAELQILGSRLASVADEMGAVLRRAASSPNIKERADCSAALFTATGELLAQAEHIPVHLGSMPASVAAAIATGLRAELMLNDPFAGGTHLNDLTMVAPVLVDGVLVGWVANRAHHADVGGTAPGSMPPDALTIDEEGLRLPPTPVDDGPWHASWRRRARPTSGGVTSTPNAAPTRSASAGWPSSSARWRRRRVAELFAEILDYGERRMRAALARLPDGHFAAADVLDSAGPRPEQQTPTRIVVEVRIDGEAITFDFTGTDEQRPGNVNAVEAVTVSAVAFAIRAVSDPTLPANGGTMRPVHVVAPAGTVVAAVPPVAVGAGNVEVSQRVADVCLAALAQARPSASAPPARGR